MSAKRFGGPVRTMLSKRYYALREYFPIWRMAWQRKMTQLAAVPLSKYRLPETDVDSLVSGNPEVPEPILEDICMPPYVTRDPGSNDHDDYHPLMRIIASRRPRTLLELGTAHGNTTANLCKQNPDLTVYTVNAPVEMQTGETTTFRLDETQIGRVYRNAGYGNRVTQILANTLTMEPEKFLKGPLDAAIIDACHDAEYVINDFEKVAPHMSEEGIIFLHDTHPPMDRHLYGSYFGCMKLRQRGYDIRYLRGTWWGVWMKHWNTGSA